MKNVFLLLVFFFSSLLIYPEKNPISSPSIKSKFDISRYRNITVKINDLEDFKPWQELLNEIIVNENSEAAKLLLTYNENHHFDASSATFYSDQLLNFFKKNTKFFINFSLANFSSEKVKKIVFYIHNETEAISQDEIRSLIKNIKLFPNEKRDKYEKFYKDYLNTDFAKLNNFVK